MSDESPFVPGARVAIFFGWADSDIRESVVEKVYKTGNFTLKGDPKQQWKPWGGHGQTWSALRTGQTWDRQRLKIWDASTDAEISEKVAAQKLRQRLYTVQKAVEKLRIETATEDVIAALEAALAPRKRANFAPAQNGVALQKASEPLCDAKPTHSNASTNLASDG